MDAFVRPRRLVRSVPSLRFLPMQAIFLGLAFIFQDLVCAAGATAPQLRIAPFGFRIEQLVQAPGVAGAVDLTARAAVINTGGAAINVTAQIASKSPGVAVLDGQVEFGTVGRTPLLRSVISRDTFKLRLFLPRPWSPLSLLQFAQSAVDAVSWTVSCANCGQNRPPVANAGADQTAYLAQSVILDGSASSDPDGNPLTFRWTVLSRPPHSAVQLSSASAVKPTFVSDRDGTYVFQLIVNDGIADSAPASVTVTTKNSAPVAHAGPDRTAAAGALALLDAAGSTDIDGDPLTYEWSLLSQPADSAARLLNADPASPLAEFILDKVGQYILQLVVNDGHSDSAPDTVIVSTVNSAPVANAGPDQTAAVGATVQLSGSTSSDADGDELSYHWSLTVPAGSQATLTTATGAATSFVVDKPGIYIAQLIVNDRNLDSTADTVVISTINSAPVADAGADRTVDPGDTVTLDGSGSHDVDGDALGFSWSLASKPLGSGAELSDPNAIQPSMTTDRAGPYIGQLVVNDGSVNSAPATVTVTTRNAPPQARDDAVVTNAGVAVTIDVLANDADANGDVLTLVSITHPHHGEATIAGSEVRYTPAPTFSGSDSFSYAVGDGKATATATVGVTVHATETPPSEPPALPATPDAQRLSVAEEDEDHIRVTGEVGSVAAGAQVIVSNFNTGTFVTTTAAPDGSFAVSIAAAQVDPLLVTVRDAAGNTSASTTLSADGGIELTIDEPFADQRVSGSTLLVAGGLWAPPNTGVTVNGKAAAVYYDPEGSTYEAQIELVPDPEAGEMALPVAIEVVASAPDGRRVERTLAVLVRSFSRYLLQASPSDGPAPLQVRFEITDNTGDGIGGISVDFDGDGTMDFTPTDPAEPLQWTYMEPGTYLATAKVTTDFGTVQTVSVPVRVQERSGFSSGLQGIWDEMNAALVRGNLITAKARLTESARRQYGPVFDSLVDQMPQIVASFSPLEMIEAGGNVAEFVLARETEGAPQGFFIYIVRCPDGVWRVAGM